MKRRILFIIYTYIAWIAIFAIQKIFFLLYNHTIASGYTLTEYLRVILNGLKLDASMAGYLTGIPLLLTLTSIWFPSKKLHTILKVYFAIISVIVVSIFSVDEALYGYWKFRLDSTILFYLESPTNAMASVPVFTLIVQVVKTIIFSFLLYWMFKRLIVPKLPTETTFKKWQTLSVGIVLGGLIFVAIRGGVTTSTANVGMVYFSNDQFLNHSAINPCFSLLTSMSRQEDFSSQFQFFEEEKRQELFRAQYPKKKDGAVADENKLLSNERPNILFIVLEGITANVVEPTGGEPNITPNLNKLCEGGVLFRNMYANSFRTDRGLVAILNGYLAQPTTSIMKYPAKSQTLPSIALSLRNEGYATDVLYGGDINFTNMRSFFYNSGYNNLTSDVDFPISSRLSKWGANDDVTFERLYDDIINKKEKKTPWHSTFLTLSSHEPFIVPYNRLEHPYLNSVAFTDSCLGDFIDKMKMTPAWDDLLIVLVSDHGFPYPDDTKNYEPKRYHIPCLWIGGAVKSPRIIDKYINQTDLAATLLNQLNIDSERFQFSRDIFGENYTNFSFYTFNNGFGYIDTTSVTVFDNTMEAIIYGNKENKTKVPKGKAILQTLYKDLGSR